MKIRSARSSSWQPAAMKKTSSGQNNPAQSWQPEEYEKNAGFVADLGLGALDLLDPRPGQRVLDLGCGHGKLSEKIAQRGCHVVCVDASPEQVAGASARGLDARVMDGTNLDFKGEFDAVFTNAALHWMKDADAVIDGVWKALVPGGCFAGEFGGAGNVARVALAIERALDARGLDIADYWPWYFPSPDDYAGRLAARGFSVQHMELFSRPTPIPGDIEGWLDTFCESFYVAVSDDGRRSFIDDIRDDLAADLCGPDGIWTVDYVRLRFRAVKP